MNKYQESLNTVSNHEDSHPVGNDWHIKDFYPYEINVLQELVDRRTPMKPVGKYTDFKCGYCGTRVRSGKGSSSRVKDTVCRNCYQVIDWK